jgi:predicted Fe-Mo cluster-binding NifX family protein
VRDSRNRKEKKRAKGIMKIKLACGTDNETEFTDGHFGSSKYFLIYDFDLETKDLRFLKRIENSTQEEEKHGDIKKAKSVSELLKNVSVLVAFRYGPNIIRIKRRFVPIISREKNIEKILNQVKLCSNKIKSEMEKEKGIDKEVIYIKK